MSLYIDIYTYVCAINQLIIKLLSLDSFKVLHYVVRL